MADERLTSSDKRTLVLWILLGLAGVLFAHKYFFRAFPEASVDFKVSRSEALERARQFVASLGEDLRGYESAIVFDVDDNAKTYLEREVGLQQANQLMSSQLNIWFWNARFFRPGQEEEFYVRVSPAGQVVGYEHKVPEAQAGAALARSSAEQDAREFLSGKLGVDLSKWTFLPEEANSSKRANRTDWSFTWEKTGFRARDAADRLRVTFQGDRAGDAEEFLQVPESWQRSFAHLRSTNIFYNQVAIIPYLLLMGSALWLGITLTRQGRTTWGPAIKLGIVVAILLTFMQLNNWPLDRMGYDTNTAYGSFVFQQIGLAILFGIGSALTISLILPGAEPLYRASYPDRLQLTKAFTLRGMRSREFFKSATIGLAMAAGHIGFIVAFYMIAGHFGAWAPQDVNYENTVNTAFPWISGVAIGMLAATSEEFLFRLFAIPFLKRLTSSNAVAVIVPAFCWSFLHSAYPNEPPYIRGLEVGLIGVVAGVVMLRWGILATLIWHYTVDASLVGLLLVRSNSLYFKVSGVVVGLAALAPLLFAGISYLARGRFEDDQDLLNSAEPVQKVSLEQAADTTPPAATLRGYQALAPGILIFLVVCLVAGAVALWRLKVPAVGDYLKLSVNANGARARADEALRQHGVDPSGYRHATIFVDVSDPYVNEFLRERVGLERLNQIYAAQVPVAVWQVRYFKDGQPEEYSIKLGPDGRFLAFNHKIADEAAGASLSKEQAQAKAEAYLRDTQNLDLRLWTLVEANSDKRDHRTDHELCWQKNAPLDENGKPDAANLGHAYARVKVAVLGDQAMDYRGSYYSKSESRDEAEQRAGATAWSFVKIPDEWRRQQESQSLLRTLLGVALPLLFAAVLGIAAIVIFFQNLRSEAMRAVPWKRLAPWAALALLAYAGIASFGSRVQYFLNSYPTAIPLKTVIGGFAIAVLVGAVLYTGGVILLAGVGAYFSNRAFGLERLPLGAAMPGVYYRDAALLAIGGAAGFLGFRRIVEFAAQHWPTIHRSLASNSGQLFDALSPSAMAVGSALIRGLYAAGAIFLLASFVAAMIKAPWLRFVLFLLGALTLSGGDWGNAADFAKQFVAAVILLAVIVLGVRRVLRFNVLGGFLLISCMSLLATAAELLAQPNSFYRTNGYVVLAVMLALLAYPLTVWRMRPTLAGGGETADKMAV